MAGAINEEMVKDSPKKKKEEISPHYLLPTRMPSIFYITPSKNIYDF